MGCDTTFVRRRAQEQLFLIILFSRGTEQFFPCSRLKTMAEIENDISQFSFSGPQLAPVSLAPTTAGEAGSMPARVPQKLQHRTTEESAPIVHAKSDRTKHCDNRKSHGRHYFPHNKMAQKSLK